MRGSRTYRSLSNVSWRFGDVYGGRIGDFCGFFPEPGRRLWINVEDCHRRFDSSFAEEVESHWVSHFSQAHEAISHFVFLFVHGIVSYLRRQDADATSRTESHRREHLGSFVLGSHTTWGVLKFFALPLMRISSLLWISEIVSFFAKFFSIKISNQSN